jgi:hypothetical protein
MAWRGVGRVLDVVPGPNIVFEELRDTSTVWLEHQERNPQLRYKMMVFVQSGRRLRRYCSPDGIHWQPAGFGGPSGDRSTFFFNAFRDVWVYSIRDDPELARYIGRHRRVESGNSALRRGPMTRQSPGSRR